MTSQKEIATNRGNAQQSTRPKTQAGKAKSAQNAIKHGVLSGVSVAENEDEALFEAMLAQLQAEHAPQTTIEAQLVERLALLLWRKIRLAKAEAFQSQENRKNVQFETEMSKCSRDYTMNMLPRNYLGLAGVLPIET